MRKKNLKNQLFVKQDIDKKKADVLAKRYSSAYDIQIASFSDSYIEDVDSLKKLFYNNHLDITTSRPLKKIINNLTSIAVVYTTYNNW